MKAEIGSRIRIVKKNDDYSQDYQVGDEFTVEEPGTGGVHVTSLPGSLFPWMRRSSRRRIRERRGRLTVIPTSWE